MSDVIIIQQIGSESDSSPLSVNICVFCIVCQNSPSELDPRYTVFDLAFNTSSSSLDPKFIPMGLTDAKVSDDVPFTYCFQSVEIGGGAEAMDLILVRRLPNYQTYQTTNYSERSDIDTYFAETIV